MKLRRLIEYCIIAFLAWFFIIAILPSFILPQLDIGKECGWDGTPIPSFDGSGLMKKGESCTCYGLQYMPELTEGAQAYKCAGYCPSESCKEY